MHKALTWLFLIGICAAAAWTLFGERSGPSLPDPWKAVPSATPMVIEIEDPVSRWDRWSHSSRWWQVMAKSGMTARVDSIAGRLSQRAETDRTFAAEIGSLNLLVALFPAAENGVDALFVWSMRDGPSLATLVDALNGMGLTITRHKGLVLASSRKDLITGAIEAFDAPQRDRSQAMTAARSSLGREVDAHILVDLQALPRLLGQWLAPGTVDGMHLGEGWAALDVSVQLENILLSGIRRSAGSIPSAASVRPVIARALPSSVCAFSSFPTGGMRHDTTTGDPAAASEAHAFLDWSDGRAVIATAPPDSNASLTWAVLGTSDPELTLRSLAALCDSNGCDTVRYRDQLMTRIDLPGSMERTFGTRWWRLEQPWYTVLGDEVAFCDDLNGLKQAVDAWTDGTGLAGDLAVADVFQQNAVASTHADLWHVARGRSLLAANATGALQNAMDEHPSLLASMGSALLMRSPAEEGTEYVTIVLTTVRGTMPESVPAMAAGNTSSEGSSALWSVQLPAPPARKPFIVRNHMNNTREVLVQDERHGLHLISAAGGVLWSRALDGPILGDVHQIDRFKNGKLQLLFNTASMIHLVDRNGKDVEGFPVKVKDGCSAPLAVFDYERTRTYRILLPTEEGGVLNLDIDGRAVEGWAPPRTERVVNEVVRAVTVRGKDHLLVFDGGGTVHVWGRRGEVRYEPPSVMKALDAVLDVRPGASIGATTVVWRDTEGVVRRVTLDGRENTVLATNTTHAAAGDVGGTLRTTRANGDTLTYISRKGSIVRVHVPGGIMEAPQLHDLGSRWLVCVLAADAPRLFDADGVELASPVLSGHVLPGIADLNLDGRFEVISGTDNGIAAYRLP